MALTKVLVALLLTASVALLAGCASAPADPEDADRSGSEAPAERLSVAPEAPAPRGPTRTVDLGTTQLVATSGVDHVVGVQVPADAKTVLATLTFQPGAVQDLTLDLAGCRLLSIPSASAAAGTVILTGECKASELAGEGLQQATLHFATGAFVGTLRFEAEVPA